MRAKIIDSNNTDPNDSFVSNTTSNFVDYSTFESLLTIFSGDFGLGISSYILPSLTIRQIQNKVNTATSHLHWLGVFKR